MHKEITSRRVGSSVVILGYTWNPTSSSCRRRLVYLFSCPSPEMYNSSHRLLMNLSAFCIPDIQAQPSHCSVCCRSHTAEPQHRKNPTMQAKTGPLLCIHSVGAMPLTNHFEGHLYPKAKAQPPKRLINVAFNVFKQKIVRRMRNMRSRTKCKACKCKPDAAHSTASALMG